MKRLLPIIAITIIIGSGIGGIITGTYPSLGTWLVALGVIWQVFNHVSTERRSQFIEKVVEEQNRLLAQSGAGNPYTEIVKKEFKARGRFKDAIPLLRKALDANPFDREALEYYVLIMTLTFSFRKFVKNIDYGPQNKDWVYVTRVAQKAHDRYPEKHVFLDAMGILLDIAGQHEAARKMFMQSSKLRNDPYWHILMGTSYGMSGKFDFALKEIEAAMNNGAHGWHVEYQYSNVLAEIGRYEEAYVHVVKAIKLGGSLFHLLPIRQKCLFFQAKLIAAAFDSIKLSLLLFSFNRKRAFVFLMSGMGHLIINLMTLMSRKIWPATRYIPLFNRLQYKIINPCEPDRTIGSLLIEQEKFEMALRHFQKCRQICPNDIDVLINLSGCYALFGDRSSAIKTIDEAIKLDPRNELLIHNREQFASGIELKRTVSMDKRGETIIKTVNKP